MALGLVVDDEHGDVVGPHRGGLAVDLDDDVGFAVVSLDVGKEEVPDVRGE